MLDEPMLWTSALSTGKKVTDHHAILPTRTVGCKVDLEALPKGEQNVLEAHHCPNADGCEQALRYLETQLITECREQNLRQG